MQYIPQKNIKSATASFADSLLIVCYYYKKGRVKKLRFSHALYNVVTYEIMSANNSTLIILTSLPAQHLMAILCDEYHDFPLG